MTLLRGALRVDAQTDAFARRLCRRAELCQLAGRVEHDVVGVLQQFLKLICPVGGAEHMVLLLRQLFPAQAALVQAAGLGTCQIGCQHRVDVKVGKSLLRQQDAAAGALLHTQQDLAVAAQLGFVQQIAGGGQAVQLRLGQVCQPRKGRAAVAHPHQSTRAGLWLSERGQAVLIQCIQIRIGIKLLDSVHALGGPLAGEQHQGTAHGGHAGGVADSLRAHFLVALLMVADVVDIVGLILAVLFAGKDAADVGLAFGTGGQGWRGPAAEP